MNITLWIFQVLIALHTIMGAVWKFSNSAEQTMPSLKMIPNSVWISMAVIEILVGLALVIPAIHKPFSSLIIIGASVIVLEMIVFTSLHLISGATEYNSIIYWLVVACICALIAYGRFAIKPL